MPKAMRLLSEKKAIERLAVLRSEFENTIRSEYEHRAKPCAVCETPGACCLDAHFVNVHISRLEAVTINQTISSLGAETRDRVRSRTENAIARYGLDKDGDTYEKKFACPLFEPGIGCLVHDTGKPAACVVHACYDNPADLPPQELQTKQELLIDDLNARTYGRRDPWLPIPLAIKTK